jgi:hypothetical protein
MLFNFGLSFSTHFNKNRIKPDLENRPCSLMKLYNEEDTLKQRSHFVTNGQDSTQSPTHGCTFEEIVTNIYFICNST